MHPDRRRLSTPVERRPKKVRSCSVCSIPPGTVGERPNAWDGDSHSTPADLQERSGHLADRGQGKSSTLEHIVRSITRRFIDGLISSEGDPLTVTIMAP